MKRSLFLFPLLLVACASPLLNPPTGPGTDYPCGTRGVLCRDRASCCWIGQDCGGDVPGCPPGMCCANGSVAVSRDGGVPERSPMFSPRSNEP